MTPLNWQEIRKLAIEAQGGTIGVDPRAPEGSTFWFELPN